MTDETKRIVEWLRERTADLLAINRNSVGEEREYSYHAIAELRGTIASLERGDHLK